jgi:deoxyribodipyrimidine photolyase-like uncharacterized protein
MAYPDPTQVAPWYLRNITQAYEYVLTAATTGTNQTVYASIQWQEVT